jgi:hypothetical protein
MIALSKKQEGVYLGTLGILGDFHLQQIRIDRKNPPTTPANNIIDTMANLPAGATELPIKPNLDGSDSGNIVKYTILNTSHQTNLPQSKD